jgi:hypothetical protein
VGRGDKLNAGHGGSPICLIDFHSIYGPIAPVSLDKCNPMDYIMSVITIVELPEFIRRSKKLLTEDEQSNLINYLATHPTAGVLMQGTGGIRKVRWKREGTGKVLVCA